MLSDIPDANVWVALAHKQHVHHSSARRWWLEKAADKVAFCRLTMLAFLRISTNANVFPNPPSMSEVWQSYHKLLADTRVITLPEPAELDRHYHALTTAASFKHKLWTDAYLASFAIAADCRLVSFDNDFYTFPGLNFLHLE